ncbi:MAG TPA: response regulator, partial [Nevskia sp.]|nr:response regulator [Nevskia sp.]
MNPYKPSLLLVDDEERILRSLAMLFRGQYALQTTTDAREALNIIGRGRVDVIVSDQKMPIMRGADLLREV